MENKPSDVRPLIESLAERLAKIHRALRLIEQMRRFHAVELSQRGDFPAHDPIDAD
jgi:hypothetical protein